MMKRLMMFFTGVLMAVSLAACSPTTKTETGAKRTDLPAGAVAESSVDGALEKAQMVVDADPTVTVCVYSVNAEQTGLKQNMDAVDGETLDATLLVDKMIELGVLEQGTTVVSFDNTDGVLTLDLSALKNTDDPLLLAAIGNTFTQNFEAKELKLSVGGAAVGDLTFIKQYKKMK